MRHLKLGFAALGLAALGIMLDALTAAQPRHPQPEKNNMELVGYHDLQGRTAYQPLVHKQGDRWIAYVGHHGDLVPNPLTGKQEHNGTSILDVTNPKQPQYLAHIPGELGKAEAGGAQMVRVCDGSTLPRADKSKVYLLDTPPTAPTPGSTSWSSPVRRGRSRIGRKSAGEIYWPPRPRPAGGVAGGSGG